MDRFIAYFSEKAVPVMLFFLGLLFFSWPVLSIAEAWGPFGLFHYFFIVWAGLVLLLFLTARGQKPGQGPRGDKG